MARYWRCRGLKLAIASSVLVGGAIAYKGDCAHAQIAPDGTLPNNSIVTSQGNTSVISGGTQAGGNLFHSFDEFSVPTGSAVYFNNSLNIQNVISQVTGESISNIDGLLGANGTANVFLLNPNGIIFGPNASLNIGGSFMASTASAVNFADGTQFSATAPQSKPLLRVSIPLGLQYGGSAGSIVNQSQATNSSGEVVGLQVLPGKTLALVGGNVRLEGGNLQAPGGQVELGGVQQAGTVGLFVDDNNIGLSFPVGGQLADVSLTNGASVNVRSGGRGSIAINAENLNLAEKSNLRAGIDSELSSIGSQAGDVEINATEAINLNDSFIANAVLPIAVGKGGDINITTRSLALTNGAQLNAVTLGQGDAGSVNINARDLVSFDGESAAASSVESGAVGNSGSINITTGSLALANGAQLTASTFGQGDAGSVNINVRDTVSFDGVGSDGSPSSVFSSVNGGAVGNGGSIDITTGSLTVSNGAQLTASTFGQGDAGTVTVLARDTVSFDGVGSNRRSSAAFSAVEEGAVGNGGDVNITTGSLFVTNGAQLLALTRGQGDAGSVKIRATDRVSFDGVGSNRRSSAALSTVEEPRAVGNGGSIDITTGSLTVRNGAQLLTLTRGQGNAGSVTITATDRVSFDGVGSNGFLSGAFSTVEEGAVGNGGDINITTGALCVTNDALLRASTLGQGDSGDIDITTGSLFVTNGAQLYASTFGQGDAGNVTITATDMVLFDGVGSNQRSSVAFSTVEEGSLGNGGDINITTGSLFVTNGAQLTASTFGQGDAGSVNINVRDTVSFDGVGSNGLSSGAGSAVGTGAVGNGGGINITTESLSVKDGAFLSASTFGQGNGGNITLNASNLEAVNGGQVLTTSFSSGKAGNITLNVTDSVTLSGSDTTYLARLAQFGEDVFAVTGPASGLFANTSENSTGQGGDLRIETGQLTVRDGAQVAVSNEGSGNAGNLEAMARNLLLENLGKLTAQTASGNGGNITLRTQDLLLLRRNSQISTTAGTAGTGGDGGNITIDTDFIVAVPEENSDIKANAFLGQGGQVTINAQSIFGLAQRNLEDLQTLLGTNDPIQLDPINLPSSDITAISQTDPELGGQVTINTPDVDPSSGLVSLPTVPIETEVVQACQQGGSQVKSEFIITGRGGLPPNPGDSLSTDAVQVDLITLNPEIKNRSSAAPATNSTKVSALAQIVEAQGWVINGKGEVMLTATAPNLTPHNPWIPSAKCHTSQTSS